MSLPVKVVAQTTAAPSLYLHDATGLQEHFRELFVALSLPVDSKSVIAVTSAVAGEGRTTVALGLAETLADDLETIVTLVDADFDHSTVTERYGLVGAAGLSDVLSGDLTLADVGAMVSERLRVVPIGSSSPSTRSLLRQIPESPLFGPPTVGQDVTILDLPPLLNDAYSSVAAQIADAVVLVVRAGGASEASIRAAIARLEDNVPRGVVFIEAPPPPSVQSFSRWLKRLRQRE
jgi:Mrp family chromosome partitioning ATPase